MRRFSVAILGVLPLACTFDGLDGYTQGDAGANDVAAEATPPLDASTDVATDVGAQDVGSDAPPPACNLSAPFGTPTALTSLNTNVIDGQAELSPDELTIYFESNRANLGSQMFTASRATTADAFGSVVALTSLDFNGSDTWNATLTGNALTAYYVTDQGGADNLYVAKRASSLVAFSGYTKMPSPIVEGEQPYVLPDGSALYYTDPHLSALAEIVRAQLGTTPTTAVQAISVATKSVGIPVVTPDEKTIYFAVYDAQTFTSFDIYTASRATATSAWGTPTPVTELNTAVFEVPSWVSANGCEIYFTRAPTGANWDLYVAHKP